MRVIAGKYRSRPLRSLRGMDIRPTSDRLRETLFNVLTAGDPEALVGSVWLDLFAGTGAVGIEALSRGAKEVHFVEHSDTAAQAIRKNLHSLGIVEGFEIVQQELPQAFWRMERDRVAADVVFRVVFDNRLPEPTSIHWHGFEDTIQNDGQPGISQEPVKPGGRFIYEFNIHQAGTYFYHSHMAMQEMAGMLGAFIMHPKEPYQPHCDKDFLIHLQEYAVLPNNTVPNTMNMEFNWLVFNGKPVRQPLRSSSVSGTASASASSTLAWTIIRCTCMGTPSIRQEPKAAGFPKLAGGPAIRCSSEWPRRGMSSSSPIIPATG